MAYRRGYERHAPLIQVIFGLVLIAVSIALIVIALQVASDHSRADQSARVACIRAREFGPELANFYAATYALSPEKLRDFRESIPKVC